MGSRGGGGSNAAHGFASAAAPSAGAHCGNSGLDGVPARDGKDDDSEDDGARGGLVDARFKLASAALISGVIAAGAGAGGAGAATAGAGRDGGAAAGVRAGALGVERDVGAAAGDKAGATGVRNPS